MSGIPAFWNDSSKSGLGQGFRIEERNFIGLIFWLPVMAEYSVTQNPQLGTRNPNLAIRNMQDEILRPRMKLHKVKKRTAEPKNIEYRMSKDGIASLRHFFIKIDRIHSFDIRHSLFDIRYSLFQSFSFDQTGRFSG